MRFGEMIQSLRKGKGLTLRQLAEQVEVGFHYLSKVENQKLDFGDYPSDALICRLAVALDANVDELLLRGRQGPRWNAQSNLRAPRSVFGISAMTPR